MITTGRRLACLLSGFLFSGICLAQTPGSYPHKPIRIIVPLAAGSAVDNAARIVAQKMSQNLGQAIVIENQPGASGLIGADRVAKSPPDGYTLGGFNDSIMTMLPNLQSKMSWDIVRDFEPVSLVATIEWGLVVAADAPQRSAADLIAAARKTPGLNSWFALMAPVGTSKGIVNTLHTEITKALADPEVREKLLAQGLSPRGTSPDELARDMRVQLAHYAALIKQAGITAE